MGVPVSPYIPRFRNITDTHPDFIRGYHFQGGGGCAEFPGMADDIAGYGKAFKSNVRKYYPASSASAALARCCRARRTASRSIRS